MKVVSNGPPVSCGRKSGRREHPELRTEQDRPRVRIAANKVGERTIRRYGSTRSKEQDCRNEVARRSQGKPSTI